MSSLDKKALHQLGQELIHSFYPNEEYIFDAYGEEVVALALKQSDMNSIRPEKGTHFEFGESTMIVLNISMVLVNLVTAIIQCRAALASAKKDKDDFQLETLKIFKELLLKDGRIAPDKIDPITAKVKEKLNDITE